MNKEERKEYRRLKKLFDGADERQLAALDGIIIEAAKLRCQLQRLNEIADESGLIRIHPKNPTMQKELPVSRMITRVSASYKDYMRMISNALGKATQDEGDDEFESEYG